MGDVTELVELPVRLGHVIACGGRTAGVVHKDHIRIYCRSADGSVFQFRMTEHKSGMFDIRGNI